MISEADRMIDQAKVIHPQQNHREMFMSEIDTMNHRAGNNRPTMATGMVEENSSLYDGHPEFELIGSDFVPSQKAANQDDFEPTSPTKVEENEANNCRIPQVNKLLP